MTSALEAPNPVGPIAPGAQNLPELIRRKKVRLFYNKNTTSSNSIAQNLAQQDRTFTLQGVRWVLARVSARPDRITSETPRVEQEGNPPPGASCWFIVGKRLVFFPKKTFLRIFLNTKLTTLGLASQM